MPGERSGRDHGHDHPMWPAYDAGTSDDSASRHDAGPWAGRDPWAAGGPVPHQPDPWSAQPDPWSAQPDPWAAQPPQPDPWSAQPDPWSGQPPQPAGDYPAAGYPPVAAPPPSYRPPPAAGPANGHRTARRDAGRSGRPRRRGLPLWQELPLLLVIAFCLAILVRTFLLQAFYIPSGSMEDTLIAGDRVLVNKVVYQFREPTRGEVVVFEGTDAWAPISAGDEDIGTLAKVGRTLGDLVGISRPGAKDYIKRVIAVPGDTVSCCDVEGRVFVNGAPLDEEYVIRNSPLDDVPPGDCRSRRFDEVVVQPGQMFVMGDHRQVSQDSRCQGQVPIDNVIGRAFVVVWPNDRWATLSRPGTFTEVPQPGAAPLAPAGPVDPSGTVGFVLPLLLPLGLHSRLARRVPGSPGAADAVGSRSD